MEEPRLGPRVVIILVAVLGAGMLTSGPAIAHEGDVSDQASVLVRQAIALIVADPGELGEIREKVTAALAAADASGVDLELVERADVALAGEDLASARTLLESAIGAGPPPEPPEAVGVDPPAATTPPAAPQTPGEDAMADMATGAQPGRTLITEPLEIRPHLNAVDWAVLAGAILVGLGGVWLATRHGSRAGRTA